jgi:hypothetical protein
MAPEKQEQQPPQRPPTSIVPTPAGAPPGSTPSTSASAPATPATTAGARGRAWYALLVAPFVGMLWVPFYNRIDPKAGSIPFFYWYQFVWIGISAVLTAVVYFATRDDADR